MMRDQNLEELYTEMYEFCSEHNHHFKEKFRPFAKEVQVWLNNAIDNYDYCVYQPTKKGGYLATYPFYDFWLKQVLMYFEIALWNAYFMDGGKKAEKRADVAVEEFRKKFDYKP